MGTISHPPPTLAQALDALRTRLDEAGGDKTRQTAVLREAAPGITETLPYILAPRRWRDPAASATALATAVGAASVDAALSSLLDATVEPGAATEARKGWSEKPEPRGWFIPGWLPVGRLGLLSGAGGVGKSTLAVHLISGIAGGEADWLPGSGLRITMDKRAPVVLWSAEDEGDEVARRLHRIGRQGVVGDRLHYLNGAGACPLWAPMNGSGHVSTRGDLTLEGAWVRAYAQKVGAVLLVLDSVAAAYGCDENARPLVRKFCASWDAWGVKNGCTVMLIGHPPKSGSEYAGSTDWHNAARWWWYYDVVQVPKGQEDDVAPQLSLPKGNYSPPGEDTRCWIARNHRGPRAATTAMSARDVHAGRVTNVKPSRTAAELGWEELAETAPDTDSDFEGEVA